MGWTKKNEPRGAYKRSRSVIVVGLGGARFGDGSQWQREERGLDRVHVGRTAVVCNESGNDAECTASSRDLLVRDILADGEEHEG